VNNLFIEFYLDEDVSVLVADLIRARGFAITTTQKSGQRGKSDAEQLDYAVKQRAALVTHNRADFEVLAGKYFNSGLKHYGIVIAVRRPAHEIARRLLVILNHVTADEIEDQVRYV
jgi:tRNA A37 threonylcarbamoyladenosine synthetase subunit TsaC/SUA5/YrdC